MAEPSLRVVSAAAEVAGCCQTYSGMLPLSTSCDGFHLAPDLWYNALRCEPVKGLGQSVMTRPVTPNTMKMGQAPIVLIGASPIFMAGTGRAEQPVHGSASETLREKSSMIRPIRTLKIVALFSLWACASICEAKPNIVLVFTDDQTYRAIGYNNPAVKTPTLDRLARSGTIFSHAYVATPICAASRASILTGLFPQQHESVGLDGRGFQHHVVLEKKLKTIAHYLGSAGYTTGFCGKSHLGDPKKYGFQHGRAHGDVFDVEAFKFAEEFVDQRAADKKPFFLWIATRQPHVPLIPKQKWLDMYADDELHVDANFRESPPAGSLYNQGLPGELYYRDSQYTRNYKNLPAGPPRSKAVIRDFLLAYYATISHLDHQVGLLVEKLQQHGLSENTAIIYLSDNGYHVGNHGLGNKITMHEESVRVPMFVRYPAMKNPGRRSDAMVSSLDVMPTVLELAGIERPAHLMGKSLVPLLVDPKRPLRDFVASECIGVGGKVGHGHRMVRTTKWKYILTGVNEEALFDQTNDVYELENLAGDPAYRDVLRTMRSHMRSWMKSTGDTHTPPPEGS